MSLPHVPGHGEACVTCGDVALPLTVVRVDGDSARCRDDASGAEEDVAVDLVAPVTVGDRLLVHARVALERIADDRTARPERAAP